MKGGEIEGNVRLFAVFLYDHFTASIEKRRNENLKKQKEKFLGKMGFKPVIDEEEKEKKNQKSAKRQQKKQAKEAQKKFTGT